MPLLESLLKSKVVRATAGVSLAYALSKHRFGITHFASTATTGDPNAIGNFMRWTKGTVVPGMALQGLGMHPQFSAIQPGFSAMAHENIQAYYGGPSAPIGENPLYEEQLAYALQNQSAARLSSPMSLSPNGNLVMGLYNNRLR